MSTKTDNKPYQWLAWTGTVILLIAASMAATLIKLGRLAA